MGEFILCTGKKAEQPFFYETLSVRLYTLEELCCYMGTHLFLIDQTLVGEPLFAWIEGELGLEKLAADLREVYGTRRDVYGAVERIFRESGFYSPPELDRLSGLIRDMRGKTDMERLKLRGDLFLEAGRYRRAAYAYLELLSPEHELRMTEELQGNILHNLGVAYARLFLFREASDCFVKAWQKRKDPRTREAYLYAQNFLPASSPIQDQEMELNFTVMREALEKFTEAGENAEYYRERRAAAAAAEAFDWKGEQDKVIKKWCEDYEKML